MGVEGSCRMGGSHIEHLNTTTGSHIRNWPCWLQTRTWGPGATHAAPAWVAPSCSKHNTPGTYSWLPFDRLGSVYVKPSPRRMEAATWKGMQRPELKVGFACGGSGWAGADLCTGQGQKAAMQQAHCHTPTSRGLLSPSSATHHQDGGLHLAQHSIRILVNHLAARVRQVQLSQRPAKGGQAWQHATAASHKRSNGFAATS